VTGQRARAATGAIDAKVVNRALREIVWPDLKRLGFSRRTPRSAWRDRPDAIQVVNFQSFNSYLAEAIGSTTYSFGVNLGVFYPAIAEQSSDAAFIPDELRPAEWHCQARKHLGKGIVQPNEPLSRRWFDPRAPRSSLGTWVDRPDVWYVLDDGSNLDVVVNDARDRIIEIGLPWLDRLSDLGEARRHFETVESSGLAPGIGDEDYGGAMGSSNRLLAVAALSMVLGERPAEVGALLGTTEPGEAS
jgi:hypothetical protein